MTITPISEPYQPTVGAFAELLRTASGGEASDPAKVAHVVRDLAGRDDAPVRILLGADAVQYAQAAAQALAESDEEWRHMSASVSC
ncbi:hypothetical protein [Streptomyces sp. NPDC050564]|uniref:hypothetical protein n=1 Tax=Streptomyces sp. NPDC050564 TaxID=3365631 RepID=UPI0037876DE8